MCSFLETIRVEDGTLCNLKYHQQRLDSVVEKSIDLEDVITTCKDFPKYGLFRCRLVYNSFSEVESVTFHSYKKRKITTFKVIFDNVIEYSKKYEDRTKLNQLFEQRDGCDEILIVKDLKVTDTTIANVAFYRDGVWVTPKNPLLKGTTRQRLLDDGFLVEEDIMVHQLRTFTQVALLNAMIEFDIVENFEFLI